MRELITPAQSQTLVQISAVLLTLFAGACGWRRAGWRGAWLGLLGPLLFAAWTAHQYVTRFDPATGYFGLDKVSVLLAEVVVFAGGGALIGWIWKKVAAQRG